MFEDCGFELRVTTGAANLKPSPISDYVNELPHMHTDTHTLKA